MAENFEPSGVELGPPRTPAGDFWHHFRRNRPAVAGSIIVTLLALFALSGFVLTDVSSSFTDNHRPLFDPNQTNVKAQFVPPFSSITLPAADGSGNVSRFYLLGTDDLGRDTFFRLWSGATVSLLVGFVAVGISIVIGIFVGGISGFYGKGKVSLPFVLTVMGPPLGLLARSVTAFGVWADVLFYGFMGLAAASLAVQLLGAVLRQAWQALVFFAIGVAICLGFFVYPLFVEQQGPFGAQVQANKHALEVHSEGLDLYRAALTATKDYELAEQVAKVSPTDEAAKASAASLKQVAAAAQLTLIKGVAALELELAKVEVANREAGIHDAELAIARTGLVASDEMAATEDRSAATGAVEASQKKQKALIGKLAEANTALAKAEMTLADKQALTELTSGTFRSVPVLRKSKEELRATPGGLKNTIKTATDAMRSTNFLYKMSTSLALQIFGGFVAMLSLLLLAKAAQDGARDTRWLRPAFVPVITVDNLAMRVVEIMLTMPTLVLLLTIVAFYERNVWLVMFVIGILSWMGTARYVRAEMMSLRERDFVSASRALGLTDARIIMRHMIPNALSPVLVSSTIGVAGAIILESTLSFLGLGAAPDEVTWGKMLNEARAYMTHAPWLFITPTLAILVVVLAFNLLGEGLREAMNPKLRKR
jgi:ABC-type dipeptide/oligopeptide/nickel transport system permease subunit